MRSATRQTKRDPRESWFIWTGDQDVPVEQVRSWYRRRFSHEYSYRFLKQDLLWTQAHLRTPEPVERRSWIVACACNRLLLSHQIPLAVLRPWESQQRPATPRQVRRVMPSILLQPGTPASSPKPRGKSPGWPKGKARTPIPRFPVVKKPKPVPKRPANGLDGITIGLLSPPFRLALSSRPGQVSLNVNNGISQEKGRA